MYKVIIELDPEETKEFMFLLSFGECDLTRNLLNQLTTALKEYKDGNRRDIS